MPKGNEGKPVDLYSWCGKMSHLLECAYLFERALIKDEIMQRILPYDYARCNGILVDRNEPAWCQSRNNCKRFLAREQVNDRTPFVMPRSLDSVKCQEFLEHKTDLD